MAEPVRLPRSESQLSQRLQRRVEELLDRAEQSADEQDWASSRAHAREALLLDESNQDASALLSTAEAMLAEPGGRVRALPSQGATAAAGEWGSMAREWVERNPFIAILGLETVLALVLGFLFLGDKSFWLDEATTARLINLDWSGLRQEIGATETNQALYYVLLKLWANVGGSGEVWLRFFSVLCAAAAVPAIAMLGRSLFSSRVGLTAGLLLALNPVWLYYAQEARGYALAMLLVTLSAYAFVQLVRRPSAEMAVAFVAASALAAYSHFFAILAVGSLLASLPLLRRSDVPWTLVGQCAAAIGVLLLPIAYVTLTPNDNLNWVGDPSFDLLIDHLKLQTGGTLQFYAYAALGAVGVFAAGRMLRVSDGLSRAWPAAMVLCWLVLPTLVAFGGSYIKPVFVSRYLLVSLPALALFAAFALSRVRYQTLALGLTGALVLLALPALDRVYFDMPKEDWRGVADFVLSDAKPGDAIVFHSPWVETPYSYYVAQAGDETALPSVARYDADGNEAIGERLLSEGHQRVWLVLAHAAFSGVPEIAIHRENLEASLGSTYELEEQRDFFGPVQVRLYD